MTPRRKLSDILSNGGSSDNLHEMWNQTDAAKDTGPLPGGDYLAKIAKLELEASRTRSTPGVKIEFKVSEGEYTGRRFWLDLWLTPAALPMTKRDLGKLGITSLEQLERPLPAVITCKVKLALRRDDDGIEYNRVRMFEVVGIEKPTADPFAPEAEGNQS